MRALSTTIAAACTAVLFAAIPALAAPPAPAPAPGPHFPSWANVAANATGPLPQIYVDFDPLHYTNVKLVTTTKTVDAPDISKAVLVPITGGSFLPAKRVAAADAGELATLINNGKEVDPKNESVASCRQKTRSPKDYYECRIGDASAMVQTMGAIYARDTSRLDETLDPQRGEIAVIVLKADRLLQTRKPLTDAVLSIQLDTQTEAQVLADRIGITKAQPQWKDVVAPPAGAPSSILPSKSPPAVPQCIAVPAAGGKGFAELTDGCAVLLMSDVDSLALALKSARHPEAKTQSANLETVRQTLLPFLARSPESPVGAHHKKLAQVNDWAVLFLNVKEEDFSLPAQAECRTGSGGSIATVHITGNDRLTGSGDPKKPDLDKDAVVITCYSPFAVGAAVGWSTVPQTTYSVVQTSYQTNGPSVGTPPSPAPAFQSVYSISQTQLSGRPVAGVFLHRCLCQNPGDGVTPYVSFAVAGSAKDFPSFLLGSSVAFSHKYFLTLAAHYATDISLNSVNSVNQFVPSGYPVQTGKRYVFRPAITFGIAGK